MEIYAGMIDFMDESIGRVLQHLKNKGEYDNTLIVFISDNGPSKTSIADYVALGGKAADFFHSFDNSPENKGRQSRDTSSLHFARIAARPDQRLDNKGKHFDPRRKVDC